MSKSNLVIIDNSIQDYSVIIDALQTYTKYILLDGLTDTYDTLKTKISDLAISGFSSVGIIQHNMGGGNYSLFRNADADATTKSTLANVSHSDPNLETWTDYQNFITYFKDEYSMENFDLMACALYSDENWKYVIDTLETRTGVNIRASKDDTGSANLGGNWFLETDSVNLKDVYFTDAIDEFRGVLATGVHTVVIGTDGTIYATGENGYGQLGDGTNTNRSTLTAMTTTNWLGKTPKSISFGFYHTVVLMTDGTIYATGRNDLGQLGDGTGTNRNTLTAMTILSGKTPKSISCGGHHTVVLMTDGTIYATGYNFNGQLGDGTTTNRNTLTAMTMIAGKTPKSVSCGAYHTVVLMTDGTIYASGYNYYGQLGYGTSTDRNTLTAMTIPSGKTPKSISCGANHTVVLMTDGTIYATGYNDFGQLGDGAGNHPYTLTAMTTTNWSGKTPKSISCGGNHTVVLMTDGTIYATGYNPFGQLGDGTTTNRNTLTAMTTTNWYSKTPKSISCGGNYTVVLMTDGSIYGTGYNGHGELGDGTTTNRNTLTAISGSYRQLADTNSGVQYVSVGGGANTIAYSYDGITWTGIGNSIFNSYGWCVAYSANLSRWVAGGQGTNTIAYSTDGISWTGLGTSIFSGSGEGVAYSSKLNRWVAVGSGTNSIAYSTDGITWTGLGTSIFSSGRAVAYSSQLNRWVAGGEGTNTLAYSTDGITWTGIGKSIFSHMGLSSYYSSQLNRWVAVGWGTNTIAYSTDGITWTGIGTSIFSTYGRRVFYSSQLSRWVAVGNGYGNANNNTIAYSTDGITWTGIGSSIFSMYGMGVVYHQQLNRWIAVGQGNNSIAYSTDGITWTGSGASIFSQGNDVASVYISSPTITWANISKGIKDSAFGLIGSLAPTSNSALSYGSTWTKLGSDIDGEAADDQSGYSVSMSADGTIVAIGAYANDGVNGSNSGHVRVYKYNGSAWTQLGSDIDGEALYDESGCSVSLSSDGTVVAIGARYNDRGTGNVNDNRGHVRVYKYNGSAWTQLGSDIDGEAANDLSGYSVSISADGNIVAIGAHGNDGNGTDSGHVRVYRYNGSAWTQLGSDIDGEATYDNSGQSVSLSSDGTVVAIGARFNDGTIGNNSNLGHVRVYQYNGSAWTRIGGDIDGEAATDDSGFSVSLSSDGTVVAIGAVLNDGNGSNSGHVRVYQYNGSAWTQRGADIDGEAANDQSGNSVSVSADGTVVAIGAVLNDGTTGNTSDNRGHVRVYRYNGSVWTKLGNDIDAEATGDESGCSVSISADGNIVAIGAHYNDGNGSDSGHVRVYKIDSYGNFSYTSSNTAVADVYGSMVVIKSLGTTTLTATQSASSSYTSGTATATLSILPAPTLSWSAITKNFGDTPSPLTPPTSNSSGSFTYSSSNTAVATISGSTVTIVGGGLTTITASQAVSDNYASGTIATLLTVNPIAPTLSMSNISKGITDRSFGLFGSLAPTSNATTSYGLSRISNWVNYTKNTLYSQLSGSGVMENAISTTSLINTNNYTYIQSLLGLTNMSQLKLQYKGSIDGMTPNAFHSKVANIAPLFIVIKNTAGYIATAYSTVAYSDTSDGSTGFTWRYAQAGTCWVNNLFNPSGFGTYSSTKYTNQTSLSSSIYDHKDYGLRLGGSPIIGIGGGNGPSTAFTTIQSFAAGPYTGATGTILFGANETTLVDFECYSIEAVDLTYKAAYSETANKQSLLINSSNISYVKQLLTDSTNNDTPQLKLIWKSTVASDGWSSTDWHTRVNGISPLLIVIKSTNGYIATAYTSIPYTTSNYEYNSSHGSVPLAEFSNWLNPFYNPTTGYSTVKYGNHAGTNVAIYDHYSHGPTFGGGHDLYISNTMNSYPYTSLGNTYTIKYPSTAPAPNNQTLFGTSSFALSEIECYMITIPNTVTVGRYGTPNWFPLTTPIFSKGDNINSPVSAFKLMASSNIDGASGGPGALITDLSQLKLIYRLSSELSKHATTWYDIVKNVTQLLIVIKTSNGYVFTSYTGSLAFYGTTWLYPSLNELFLNGFRNQNFVFSTTKYKNITTSNTFLSSPNYGPYYNGYFFNIANANSSSSILTNDTIVNNFYSDYWESGFTNTTLWGSSGNTTVVDIECYSFTGGSGTGRPFDSVSTTYFPMYSTISSSLTTWYQLGADIDGEAFSDQSGYSVSMSADGTVVAIGALYNDGTSGNVDTGNNRGHVRVYQYNGSAWTKLGSDIDGEAANDYSGVSVSISADGNIVAIGAYYNDGTSGNVDTGNNRGHVRVYQYNGSAWTQIGGDIDGEAADDLSGYSVSMSADGNVVAIGARFNDGNGSDSNRGHVRVYQYNGSAWTRIGGDIDGEAANDESGCSVSLSSDGTVVAIGAWYNDGNGSDSGHVRVYQYNGSAWTQRGADIDSEAANDQSGNSVSVSADGTVVAIGARYNDGNGSDSGHVRVYKYNGSAWIQRGADIDGEAANDESGCSVSLSSDGTVVAIGARYNDGGTGSNSGHVRVYRYNGSAWTKLGSDIDGEAANDYSGVSVSISSDGTVVAIGAEGNDGITGNGSDSGHVRVYKIDSLGNFTYTSSNTAVAEVYGSIVVMKSAGTTTLTATQSASTNYTSGTTTANLTILPAPTITWSNITKFSVDPAFTLTTPTSNSLGSFTYSSSNTGVATISGSTVTIVGGGVTTITATQAASGNYASGTATATLTVTVPGLYLFTSHTFTTANTSGPTGPSLSSLRTAYSSASWAQNTSYFNSTNGIQLWTVPETGNYTIRCVGAGLDNGAGYQRGGDGTSTMTLTKGEVIRILVGQKSSSPPYGNWGGAGGSFVVRGTQTPLIIVGGGGGRGEYNVRASSDSWNNTTGQNGNDSSYNSAYGGSYIYGTGGSGGYGGNAGSSWRYSGTGGGMYGDGANSDHYGNDAGKGFTNGGNGGRTGGFGGGGGAEGGGGGGGGGGYSGGGNGGVDYNGQWSSGGGGGSYSSTGFSSFSANNNTNGFVTITANFTISVPPATVTWANISKPITDSAFGLVSALAPTSNVAVSYGSTWNKLGADIDGEAANDQSGWSVSMSADGTIVAIGAPYNDANGTDFGHVRVYKYINSAWTQLGSDIDGGMPIITATVNSGSRNWHSISISSTGQYQTAVVISGNIYTSLDYGVNWTERDATRLWSNVSLSSTGQYQTAVVTNGNIYTSSNYGVSWISTAASKTWYDVSISSNGQYQTAVGWSTGIHVSSDYGASWTEISNTQYAGSSMWLCVSLSSTGQYQSAGSNSGVIYISSDYGVTWTYKASATDSCRCISVSSTGQYQTAVSFIGYIFSSSDYGVSWTQRDMSRRWDACQISLSASGQYQTISSPTNGLGLIYFSRNYGVTWSQYASYDGTTSISDQSGFSVSISADGKIVAIGANYNDGNGSNSGHVRVYRYNGSAWTQLGSDINGEAAGDESGWSVSMSADGNIVAIGARYNYGVNGSNSGHVRVYRYNGSAWTKLGSDIDGEATYDESGCRVSLSSDGTVVAIGARYNDGTSGNVNTGDNRGHVRVYKYNENAWTQLGSDIDGEAANDYSGNSVSLSSDGTVVAIGADYNDGNGSNNGHVRVYRYNGSAWTKLGGDIDGEAANDWSGYSVSMSADGTVVAIGAMGNHGITGTNSGHVRVYRYNGSAWTQQGSDIDAEATGDESGYSVSLSSDGTVVAIGARFNDGNGTDSGHVRVYKIDSFGNFSYTSSNTSVAEVYGSIVVMKSGGSTTLTATQSPSTNYTSGTATATLTVDIPSLYTFTGHTFTNASATGRTGPTLSAVRTAYSGVSWAQDTTNNYLNMTTQGIQLWTVPQTGSYTFRAIGAGSEFANSNGGQGADITTTTTLTKGEVIKILVGQKGGGGGATYAVKYDGTPIIVAGGGGSAYNSTTFINTIPLSNATTNNAGNNSFFYE